MDKRQVCHPCKIIGAILKVDKGETKTNEPENKKTHDEA